LARESAARSSKLGRLLLRDGDRGEEGVFRGRGVGGVKLEEEFAADAMQFGVERAVPRAVGRDQSVVEGGGGALEIERFHIVATSLVERGWKDAEIKKEVAIRFWDFAIPPDWDSSRLQEEIERAILKVRPLETKPAAQAWGSTVSRAVLPVTPSVTSRMTQAWVPLRSIDEAAPDDDLRAVALAGKLPGEAMGRPCRRIRHRTRRIEQGAQSENQRLVQDVDR
jgi:hypothetical protein